MLLYNWKKKVFEEKITIGSHPWILEPKSIFLGAVKIKNWCPNRQFFGVRYMNFGAQNVNFGYLKREKIVPKLIFLGARCENLGTQCENRRCPKRESRCPIIIYPKKNNHLSKRMSITKMSFQGSNPRKVSINLVSLMFFFLISRIIKFSFCPYDVKKNFESFWGRP